MYINDNNIILKIYNITEHLKQEKLTKYMDV